MSSFQWLPPTNDVSIPLTDEQDCQVVTEIVDAMKDMSKAKDTVASAYRKRFTPPEHYYQDWAIEACAWDVLLLAKQIHTGGFNSRIYDSALIDAIGETQHWHFEDRIGWICMALRTSKNVAVNLLKKEKVMTIVGAPHKLHKATLVNTKSNANRGIWTANGRDADLEHQNRPFKKRTDENGNPLPLPKRQVPIDKDTEEMTRKGKKQAKVTSKDGTTPTSPLLESSPSPSPQATNSPSSHTHTHRTSGFHSTCDSLTTNKEVETTDQRITSFSLAAINDRIGSKSRVYGHENSHLMDIESNSVGGGDNPRNLNPEGHNSSNVFNMKSRSSAHGKGGVGIGDLGIKNAAFVDNVTASMAATSSSYASPMTTPVIKTEDTVEMPDDADIDDAVIDAAHVLTLLHRGSAS